LIGRASNVFPRRFRDEYGNRIHVADHERSLSDTDIVIRVYEVRFRLRGLATRQFVLTSGGPEHARQVLQDEYPAEHIQFGRASLMAFAYRWRASDGHWSELHAHDNVTGGRVWRGHYEWWTSRLLDAARRVATGKEVDPPGQRRTAGWPFKYVRRILRQDRGDGVTLSDIAAAFDQDSLVELPDVVTRLQALGYLNEVRSGWWRITTRGNRLRQDSEGRFSRTKALELIDEVRDRIAVLNDDRQLVYRVATAVVFGSALGTGHRVGDVDVAIELERRHMSDDAHRRAFDAAVERAPDYLRTIHQQLSWPEKEVWNAILGTGRGRVSVRGLRELANLFESEKVKPSYCVIHGSWRPPRRPTRRRVRITPAVRRVLKALAEGRSLRRDRTSGESRYNLGARLIEPAIADVLLAADSVRDRQLHPTSDLLTNEWVLSAAGYAALERGYFRVNR
jgi:hypothetical protein